MDNGHEFALRLRAGCWRALLLGFGWWALTEGDPSSLAIGLTMVAAATLASLIASPPQPITLQPRALVTLAGGFLYGSLLGGWDVARRALAPSLPISPALIPYSTRLDSMPAQQVSSSVPSRCGFVRLLPSRCYSLRSSALCCACSADLVPTPSVG